MSATTLIYSLLLLLVVRGSEGFRSGMVPYSRHMNRYSFLEAYDDDDGVQCARRLAAVAMAPGHRDADEASSANRRRRRGRKGVSSPSKSLLVRGREPNVHWRWTPMEELRRDPRFVALPPASAVHVGGPSTFRWVRQDDPLWEELHEGVLTSRHVLGALGMCEERAAAALNLSASFIGRRPAQSAWRALQRAPAWTTPTPPTHGDDAFFAELNAHATLQFNAPGKNSSAARAGKLRRLGPGASVTAVRCAWGSAQESSTLRSLVEVLGDKERAVLEEAGLCMLEETAWVGADRLPPIGASPDAILRRADGTRETVEVKNVCPFVADRKRPGPSLSGPGDRMTARRVASPAARTRAYARPTCPRHSSRWSRPVAEWAAW